MRSLQVRLTVWLALSALGVFTLGLVAANLYAMHRVTQHTKRTLRDIASSVAEKAAAAGAVGEPLPPRAADDIEAHLAFIDRQGVLGVAVATPDGRELYRSRGFVVPIDEHLLRGDRTQFRLAGVDSGSEVSDLFSVWHYIYRHEQDGLIVLASDAHHFELAERLGEGVLVAALAAVLLALPLGYAASRRLLRPFHAIDEAAARVRRGDLRARIPLVTRTPELRQLIEALNATFAELDSAFHRIEQFSADAAHELRTPLTVLRGSLEVCLAHQRTPEEYQRVLADSIQEISRLSGMVRDLLLLARPGGADRRSAFTTVNLQTVAAEVVERLSLIAQEAGIRVVTDLDPEAYVPGDTALLERALYNLVHNAVRYSPRDTVVTVRVRTRGETVAVEVEDQGSGIPKDQQERIFERFYRLDPSRSAGTGLGLSMVKWITELHEGRIEVDSQPGCGSRFRVILPRAPSEPRPPVP